MVCGRSHSSQAACELCLLALECSEVLAMSCPFGGWVNCGGRVQRSSFQNSPYAIHETNHQAEYRLPKGLVWEVLLLIWEPEHNVYQR